MTDHFQWSASLQIPPFIADAAYRRLSAPKARSERAAALQLALDAAVMRHQDDEHKVEWLVQLGIDADAARDVVRGADLTEIPGLDAKQICLLHAVLDEDDFQDVNVLEKAAQAAKAVGRFVEEDGDISQGTFFMISPELLITNHHVIPDKATATARLAEFNFQLDENGDQLEVTRFELNPARFWVTDKRDDMDFTVVAIGDRHTGKENLADFGYCPLPNGTTRLHRIDSFVNIVQHRVNEFKEVVFRENRLFCQSTTLMVYRADTGEGSSGSPLFNDDWEVVGLHHFGNTLEALELECGQKFPDDVNEGIDIREIVKELKARRPKLSKSQQNLLDAALA